MRLLFVCPDMRTGGAERHWATLIPALARRDADARVLCLAEEGGLFDELTAAGVPATCVHMRRRGDPRAWHRALAFANPRPEVVISRGVSGQFVGQAIASRARAPHVLNEHTPLTPAGELLPMRHHQRLLTRLVAPRVDRVIAVTSRQIGPLARLGYRRERIEVIANGVFDSVRRPAPPATGAAKPVEGDFTVLCAARLEPEKGVGVFIRAVDAARRSRPAIRGLVAGEGPERPRLERLAAGSGVELLGVRDDVADLMAAADAVVLTSEAEALPMSVLEAMAAARPVIVTDIGGMAEAVVQDETGLLVPAGDAEAAARALVELASDRERAGRMGEAGRARQRERFDGETMVARYERTLASVAGV
jgi:glycosyltransferase involved in cell wall biosynthesis